VRRVLIVDDSVFVCNALRRDLRRAGFDTVTTSSGWTALSMVEAGDIDAVIAELAMPAMDGEELIERMALLAPDIPCVVVTGYATHEKVVSLSRQPNVFGILVKPWDHARLIDTINTALDETRTAHESLKR